MHTKTRYGFIICISWALFVAIFATGCIAMGGRMGASVYPSEMDSISAYQVRASFEVGEDDNGSALYYMEAQMGVDAFGTSIGLRFPHYYPLGSQTLYLAPAVGFSVVAMGEKEWVGFDGRFAFGLAERKRKGGSAFQRVFDWPYDTRTMSLEVSQVVSIDGFMPTALSFTLGHLL